uniref:Putative PD-(D/E)XK nuclease superfamily protein n=1 Tax=viral metagenome TaxID=1070528 RepID=A0A6M3JB94_9ZZZZ
METNENERDAAVGQGARLDVLTYSAESTFRNCRRKYRHRYVDGIVLRGEDAEALYVGDLWHGMSELLVLGESDPRAQETAAAIERRDAETGTVRAAVPGDDRPAVLSLAFLEDVLRGWEGVPWKRRIRHQLRAMLLGYRARWAPQGGARPGDEGLLDPDFEFLDVEVGFELEIRNPESGRSSRSFSSRGKVDGVVRSRRDGRLWIWERKTARSVGGDYVDRLWTDAQIQRYGAAVSSIFGEPVAGAVYDVSVKPLLKQAEEVHESPDAHMIRFTGEIEKRRKAWAEAGKDPAKWEKERERVSKLKSLEPVHKSAESDEEYLSRLVEWTGAQDKYARLLVPFVPADLEESLADTWETSQQILDARRRGKWSRNRSQCYAFGRPCAYVTLCKANQDPDSPDETLATLYEAAPPHQELGPSRARRWFDAGGILQEDGGGDLPGFDSQIGGPPLDDSTLF